MIDKLIYTQKKSNEGQHVRRHLSSSQPITKQHKERLYSSHIVLIEDLKERTQFLKISNAFDLYSVLHEL